MGIAIRQQHEGSLLWKKCSGILLYQCQYPDCDIVL